MHFTASELLQKRQTLEENIKARAELTAPDILQKSDLFFLIWRAKILAVVFC